MCLPRSSISSPSKSGSPPTLEQTLPGYATWAGPPPGANEQRGGGTVRLTRRAPSHSLKAAGARYCDPFGQPARKGDSCGSAEARVPNAVPRKHEPDCRDRGTTGSGYGHKVELSLPAGDPVPRVIAAPWTDCSVWAWLRCTSRHPGGNLARTPEPPAGTSIPGAVIPASSGPLPLAGLAHVPAAVRGGLSFRESASGDPPLDPPAPAAAAAERLQHVPDAAAGLAVHLDAAAGE
jgi:hypothetical protein